jgi:hypothetical protein
MWPTLGRESSGLSTDKMEYVLAEMKPLYVLLKWMAFWEVAKSCVNS